MAVEDLLARLKAGYNDSVTSYATPAVTLKPLPLQPVTPVTLVTPEHRNGVLQPPKSEVVPVNSDYLRSQGADLLAEDLAFLYWHLPKDTLQRSICISRYLTIWLAAFDRELVVHKKQNAGRKAANSWLRNKGTM